MFPRKAAVLAVTLTLALPWCAAAARPGFSLPVRVEASASPEQLRAGLWSWLRGAWTKVGCGLDPGGAKEGCTIDPSGAKAGCTIDPGGKPVCGSATATNTIDEGCTIDPGGTPCDGRK